MNNTLYVCEMKQVFQLKYFAKVVKYHRYSLYMGIREAAKEIGISPATLSRYENENIPEVTNYANICKWLNVPMEHFFTKAKKL